ncbi:hypothetical protein Tco_0000971 [Tanacetum coccineum]
MTDPLDIFESGIPHVFIDRGGVFLANFEVEDVENLEHEALNCISSRNKVFLDTFLRNLNVTSKYPCVFHLKSYGGKIVNELEDLENSEYEVLKYLPSPARVTFVSFKSEAADDCLIDKMAVEVEEPTVQRFSMYKNVLEEVNYL